MVDYDVGYFDVSHNELPSGLKEKRMGSRFVQAYLPFVRVVYQSSKLGQYVGVYGGCDSYVALSTWMP